MSKTFISAFALASVLSLAVPAFAQEHMISGKAVPADQVEEVQAKCDQLRTEASGGAAAGTSAPAADAAAPAAGAAATTDATTSPGTAATTGTDTTTTTSTDTTATNTTDASAEAEIDLETLTLAMCDEGGFTASTP